MVRRIVSLGSLLIQKEHTELEKARDEALRKAENALNAINMIPE